MSARERLLLLDCLWGVPLAVVVALASSAGAATVWNGPLFSYNQPAPIPTQATNQDRLTPKVWLTRAASKGLFNAVTETNAGTLSPADTEWAFGTLPSYASLPYTNWLALLNGQSPVILVGQPLVVHVISEDTYLSLQFSFWAAGGSGGFTYQRSTPAPPLLSAPVITNGQFTFSYTTDPGVTNVIQSSSNLVDWVVVETNVAATGTVPVADGFKPEEPRFYRVFRLPGP